MTIERRSAASGLHAETGLLDLGGKTALVTGASGALGRHFAVVLACAGARVIATGRRQEQIEATAEAVRKAGGQAWAVALDVTDAASIGYAFDEINRRCGHVAILVNNSGVTSSASSLDLEELEWDRVLDTNLKGSWLVSREAARRALDAKASASIINIASILGLRVAGQVSAYAASKAALIQLTRVMALELARYHVRVNALAPGYIETDLNRDFFAENAGRALVKRIPQRRLGLLSDLDGPLLLLASDASAYMTGATIAVDGGHLVSSL
ncbi:MAG: SDR family NAD(P)-dependent oxidoreductase [Janthinobacterium lividum]